MDKYKNKISVLVHSCDLYEEAWMPFFALLCKYWPECVYDIYLSTENLDYPNKNIKTIKVGNGSWSGRLKKALAQIGSEFVFLFLEDFFLQQPVNKNEIDRAVKIIEEDNDVACIYFNRITGYSAMSKYERYTLMSQDENTRYMLNCQAALWRRDVLIAACSYNMSPWEFEEYGFDNLPDTIKSMTFLSYNKTWYDKITDDDVFPYLLVRDSGYGIWKSRWLWNNKKLFRKNGISIKYKKLKKYSYFRFMLDKALDRLNRKSLPTKK